MVTSNRAQLKETAPTGPRKSLLLPKVNGVRSSSTLSPTSDVNRRGDTRGGGESEEVRGRYEVMSFNI